MARSAARAVVASAPAAVIGWAVSGLAVWQTPGAWPMKIALISGAITGSATAYAALHMAWKTDEARAVWELIKRRRVRATAPLE